MPWIPRGLREGIVTTRYPRRPDGYGPRFNAAVVVRPGPHDAATLAAAAAACPTGAIAVAGVPASGPAEGVGRDASAGGVALDRGRCVLCGRCTDLAPGVFGFDPSFEIAGITRDTLVVPRRPETDRAIAATRTELGRRTRALRRSVHIRHVDAGSDGADEWEIAALTNPVYDVQRLGIFFTASPRHADLLLATGTGTAAMLGPLRETYEVMPEPKIVIAAGVDAVSGGLVGRGYATSGGIGDAVPVDVWVPGAPASPFGLLSAILLALDLLPAAHGAGVAPPPSTPGRAAPAPAPEGDPIPGVGA